MFEIYSIGNATFLIEVFRGLARLWSTGDIYLLLSVALLLGLIWNSLLWAIDQEKSPFPAKGFVLSLVFVMGLLGPQSLVDVRITSKRDLSFQEVNDVPLLPALGGWLITNSGTSVADLMAQAFSIVGIANTWEALSPIQHFVGLDNVNYTGSCTPNPADPNINICKTFRKYLEECYTTANLISPASAQPIDSVIDAMPRDIMAQIKVTNPKIYTTSHLVSGNPYGERITCPAAWTKLNSAMGGSTFKTNLEKQLLTQGVDLDKVAVFLSQNSMQGVLPNAESSFELANLAFIKSVFADYFPNSPYGQQVSRAMFDTVRQRQLANATKKEYWMENAEVMQSFFEALTVFLTPFIGLVLAMSGHGLMAVGQYFAAWAFVQLWSVMIVLVNLFTALAMTNRFTDAVVSGKSQFSLSAIDSQFATAESYISISGMLYTFIPAICVFVLYRGVHAMQGMAKQAMADPSINAQRLSPDTGATMNDGNASFANQSSQYQSNTGEFLHGDSLVKTSMGSANVGGSASAGLTAGSQALQSQAHSKSANAQKALENVFSNNQGSSHNFNDSQSTSFTASTASEWASSAAKAISDTGAMSYKEAEQLVASGAVTVDAGGALSLGAGTSRKDGEGNHKAMFAGLGAKFGADLKASVGLGADASQSAQQTYQKNLQNAMSHKDAINSNLSKIHKGDDVLASSQSDGFQNSVKEAAAYSRQAQALTQQSTALNGLLTDSKQMSMSQEVDMAGLSGQLRNQSIGSFLQQQNPELWDKIKNSTIDGKSSEQYLQDQEAAHLKETSNKSVNPGGDARALALMDFIKANDHIDIDQNKDNGIDLNKEKQDTQTNRDIFAAMSNAGITNTGAASQFYDKKAEVLSQIEARNESYNRTNSELEGAAPTISSPNQFTQDASTLQTTTADNIAAGEMKAQQGQVNAERAQTQNMSEIRDKGNELTNGPIGNVSTKGLDKEMDKLNTHQQENKPSLDAVGEVTGAVAQAAMPGGDRGFNNFVESQTQAHADTSSYRPEYSQGVQSISELTAFTNGSMNDRLTSKNDEKVENAKSMVGVLNNEQLMTDILGKNEDGSYGSGTDLGKQHFDENTREQLQNGANWLQSYKQEASERTDGEINKTPAIDQAIARAESQQGDAAKTYLSAMQDLGLAHEASDDSDGRVFSSITEQAAEDLSKVLDKQKSGENTQNLVSEVSGGTELTSGSFWMPSGDREATRDDYTNKLDKMDKLASTMGHLLSDDQQKFVADFIGQARDRINEDQGDRPFEQMGGKDDGYSEFVNPSSSSANETASDNRPLPSSESTGSNADTASPSVVNQTASDNRPLPSSESTGSNADTASPSVANETASDNRPLASSQSTGSNADTASPSVANETASDNRPLASSQSTGRNADTASPSVANETASDNRPLASSQSTGSNADTASPGASNDDSESVVDEPANEAKQSYSSSQSETDVSSVTATSGQEARANEENISSNDSEDHREADVSEPESTPMLSNQAVGGRI
ncbi:conjugal transfer protein TraG N-terminal domain-containing protein [Shewanella algicola]|uniref:conjugal transfer protein TraG N-terminal domain-containing protein n=1 Tax=Shewanella algicola TaxID=640633 RepID=UPI002494724C|nr:conjugal transfer protein TraG N-terminal domain-containing protein [Shewanella algicola]